MDIKPAFIDHFSGCGGYTLGMERARFRSLAAVDYNAEAFDTLRRNLTHIKYVLELFLRQLSTADLAALVGRVYILRKVKVYMRPHIYSAM